MKEKKRRKGRPRWQARIAAKDMLSGDEKHMVLRLLEKGRTLQQICEFAGVAEERIHGACFTKSGLLTQFGEKVKKAEVAGRESSALAPYEKQEAQVITMAIEDAAYAMARNGNRSLATIARVLHVSPKQFEDHVKANPAFKQRLDEARAELIAELDDILITEAKKDPRLLFRLLERMEKTYQKEVAEKEHGKHDGEQQASGIAELLSRLSRRGRILLREAVIEGEGAVDDRDGAGGSRSLLLVDDGASGGGVAAELGGTHRVLPESESLGGDSSADGACEDGLHGDLENGAQHRRESETKDDHGQQHGWSSEKKDAKN